MKTFKDVFIKIDDKSIKDFISKVTDATKNHWSRAYESEEN